MLTLHCSTTRCDSQFADTDASSLFALRVRAMKRGWRYVYGADMCPGCAKEKI